jgi:hypothetical protein
MYCVESQPTFRTKMPTLSSGSKNKPRKKPSVKQLASRTLLDVGFSLGLSFYGEDGGDIFFRNIGRLSTDYTALHHRRYNSALYMFEILFFIYVNYCDHDDNQS